MPTLCPSNLCSGCGACRNVCPCNAIIMSPDENGFLVPAINQEVCSDCRLCEKTCPVLNPVSFLERREPKVYACWANDSQIRGAGSSGGMFSVYAENILQRGGTVFGAAFDGDLHAVFCRADSKEKLGSLRSSKYVQAETGTVFREVKKELGAGRFVLFTGTPCQVAALYAFLGRDDNRLLTCDILCFGVPSPGLFADWIGYLEKRLGGKVASLNFREKKKMWPKSFLAVQKTAEGSEPLLLSPSDRQAAYLPIFHKKMSLRESCFSCPYRHFPRPADLSLGDFWKIGKSVLFPYPTQEGVSLNIINSEKGKKFFNDCAGEMTSVERTLEEAVAGNPFLTRQPQPHPLRESFLADRAKLSFEELIARYESAIWPRPTFFQRLRAWMKRRLRR